MSSPTDVVTAFRQHLVDRGIVRKPGNGANPERPPMFVEPEAGPVEPGHDPSGTENDDTLVISAFWGVPIAAAEDAFRLRGTIDVRFRSKTSAGLQRAADVAMRIRAEMFHVGPGIPKEGWDMAGVPIIRSGEWAGFARIGATEQGGYDHVLKVYLEVYA